jgi:hypothetical protein
MRVIIICFLLMFAAVSCKTKKTFTEEPQAVNDTLFSIETLSETATVYFPGNDEAFTNSDTVSHYIKLELIDKKLYDSKIKSAVTFLVHDDAVKKKDSIIILKCRDSLVTFTDHNVTDETHTEYDYMGQVPFLNQYVIYSLYYEDEDIRFFDRTTGKETAFFTGYPYISPDKKTILSVYHNVYENNAELSVDRITKQGIKPVIYGQFKNWHPADGGNGQHSMFYSKDGYFYLTALQVKNIEELNVSFGPIRYLRIKVL